MSQATTQLGGKAGVREPVRKGEINAYLRLDIAYFDKMKIGDLVDRMSSDCLAIQNAITHAAINVIENLFQLFTAIAFMFYASPVLAALFLIVFPAMCITAGPVTTAMKSVSRQLSHAKASATGVAAEVLTSIRTVRAFAAEDLARKLLINFLADFFFGFLAIPSSIVL